MKISLNFFNSYWRVGLFLVFTALLTGCLTPPAASAPQKATFFRPPTPVFSGTPDRAGSESAAAGEAGSAPGSTPTGGPNLPCQDGLVFTQDLTIPDGTTVSAESTLDKRWEVENSGSCNWGEGYRVRLIAGPELGAQKEQALYPARSGSRAVIRIQFKAPAEPATYRSAWQAFNAQGEPFGDPFFIEIIVTAP